MGDAVNVGKILAKDVSATSYEYECPVDGSTCEVISEIAAPLKDVAATRENAGENFAGNLSTEDQLAHWHELVQDITALLPCHLCRGCEKAAADLRGVRLGKHERRLLRLANESYEPVLVLSEAERDGMKSVEGYNQDVWEFTRHDRSGQEATLRAMRKLEQAGLVWIQSRSIDVRYHDPRKIEAGYDEVFEHTIARVTRRAIVLTPLGKALAKLLGHLLCGNEPIRWASYIAPAIQGVRLPPIELVKYLADNVQAEAQFIVDIMKFQAIGDPYTRSPEKRERAMQEYARDRDKLSRLSAVYKALSP